MGFSRLVAAVMVPLLLTACASRTPTTPEGTAAQPTQPRAPKVLTVAVLQEPAAFMATGGSQFKGGAGNVPPMVHETLVTENEQGVFEPRLVAEQISIEKGTWRVNADGTMDTTWKLRPNVKWHDGTPFTSDDVAFAFRVFKQPDFISQTNATASRLMESIETPDPLTVAIHWSGSYVNANEARALDPLPKHLLGDLFDQADIASFSQAPYFSTDFVGVGAYRLAKWELGSHMELTAFNDYYRGRPPLDTIVVRFYSDANSMVASILSGDVEALLPVGVDMETALEMRSRWEGTGNQVRADSTGKLDHLEIQHRPEYSRPVNGFTNQLVRQALYHAVDRESINQLQTQGQATIADSYYSPKSWMRSQLQSEIPQYPYDPARAQQLLAQAGWVKGSDGVLVNQTTGDRFQTELRADKSGGDEKAQIVVAENWKAVGLQIEQVVIPVAKRADNEYLSTSPGAYLAHPSDFQFWTARFHSRNVASPANRWGGVNRGGYVNPEVDVLLDKLLVTFGEREQVDLHRQLLKEQLGTVALMPLWWNTEPTLMLKGIKGPLLVRNTATWNIFDWDKE